MKVATIGNEVMQGDEVITLKEITDILEVRHNDAMKKVEALSKEPSFGQLRKSRISYAKGKTVGTYLLNKIQAIAVGAKLNDTLLMKLVNRLEEPNNALMVEFESHKQKLQAMFEYNDHMGEVVTDHSKRLTKLEQNRRMESWMEKNLLDAKNRKVYELANNDEKLAKKLHGLIWRGFKNKFNLPRYSELTAGRYEDGLMWLNNISLADVV